MQHYESDIEVSRCQFDITKRLIWVDIVDSKDTYLTNNTYKNQQINPAHNTVAYAKKLIIRTFFDPIKSPRYESYLPIVLNTNFFLYFYTFKSMN